VGRTYYACHAEIFNSAEFVRAVARAQGRTIRVIPVPQAVGRAVLSLTGAVAAIRGRATLLTPDKANEFFQPAWIGDPSPLNRDSGWSAEHDLEAGLRKTAAWYRAHGWL
jgi:nucleoside-diphosphate-sugar epimerase